MRSPTTTIETLGDLRPDPRNARRHTERNVASIVDALHEVGAARSIVIDEDGVILAGNATVEAAGEAGIERVRVVDADGEEIIAVRRIGLTPEQKTRLALFDNRAAEHAEWDPAVLAALDADGMLDGLFSENELTALFAEIEPAVADGDGGDEFDATPAVGPTRCQPGELWALGDHRLLCGDSRDAESVSRLLDGARINVAVTSPPYASQRKYDETSGFKPIPPDEYVEWFESVQASIRANLADDGSFFLNIKEHSDDRQRHLYVKDLCVAHVRRWAWRFVDEFCWLRPGGMPGSAEVMGRFRNAWESVYWFAVSPAPKFRPREVMHDSERAFRYADQKAAGRSFRTRHQGEPGGENEAVARFAGRAFPSNVLDLQGNAEAIGHAAAYPVALPDFFIRAFSDPGDVVYEPFAGSGTTLVAAERLGRRCYAIEVSASYCDVIVRRWETETGRVAERVDVEPAGP